MRWLSSFVLLCLVGSAFGCFDVENNSDFEQEQRFDVNDGEDAQGASTLSSASLAPGINVWTGLTFSSDSPSDRSAHAMVYDSWSDKMILFGGDDNLPGYSDETWMYSYSDNLWVRLSPSSTPSGRQLHSMAYDSESDRVILFGGATVPNTWTVSDETWAYDAKNNLWTNMTTGLKPSARCMHSMAYDSQSDRVILFGGYGMGSNAETWAYDFNSNTWTDMNPSPHPSARNSQGTAYDSASDRVILFGGSTSGGVPSDETWAYDFNSNSWTIMNPSAKPSARERHAMAYDSQSDRVVLFGGWQGTTNDETWGYDFNSDTWTSMDPNTKPTARYSTAMVYDSKSDRVIIFGGLAVVDLGQTMAYTIDGNVWTVMQPSIRPAARQSHAMTYDSQSDRVVLFGGLLDSSVYSSETWSYDVNGNLWANMNPISRPSVRSYHAMAYDSQSDRVILFGGDDMLLKDETWAYDFNSNTWTNMNPISKPSARNRLAMAYDSQSDRVILFGGYIGGDASDETWAYDFNSNTWTNMNPISKPSSKENLAMAYDSQSDRVILFGGNIGDTGFLSDETWAYDFNSNTWTNMNPISKPSARSGHAMAYDPRSDRIILFGGYDTGYDDETWTYDFNSNNWANLNLANKPSARAGHTMAFDSQSSCMVLFGGWDGAVDGETWLYKSATRPSVPIGLQASPLPGKVVLQWQPPSDDGGSAVYGYIIYRGTSSGSLSFLTSVGDVLTHTDTGLINGMVYYYAVTAVNSVNESARSNEVSAKPTAVVTQPLTAQINSNRTSGPSPLGVSFVCNVTGGVAPYTYHWDFDDNGTSTLQNPTHVFESAGDYTVTMNVTDSAGNHTEQSIEITVSEDGGSTPERTSWLPIALAGIVAAVAAGVILMMLVRRKGRPAPPTPAAESQAKNDEPPRAAFCTDCGSSVPPGIGFCTNCGKKL